MAVVLVPYDEQAVRVWLVEQGFGDLRGRIIESDKERCPMAWACEKGELGVCKWLYDHGAAADISKLDNMGATPMFIACEEGHQKVCKWLLWLVVPLLLGDHN